MTSNKLMSSGTRIALLATLILTGESAMSIEKPKYTVVMKSGGIEYREYEPYMVAETVVTDEFSDAGNEGFRRLFRYISGDNMVQEKIAMTVPVERAPASEKIAMTAPVERAPSANGWRVSFVVPSQYTLDTVPVPSDPRVKIRQVPARVVAALRYSGRWTNRNHSEKRSTLLDAIDSSGTRAVGMVSSAVYNPPFTPPFMRRNEVMVEIDRLPANAELAGVSLSAESRPAL
jgi:hypothetical protein